MDVPVYNRDGEQVGAMSVDEDSLGGEINPALIKQAYVMYHANLRQGSARTRGRADVEGSGRKLYRQKGTGRARHGDKKPQIFRGGGHTFARRKSREDYHLDMPKKMRRRANRNALLAKLVDGEVKVVESLEFDTPRTKDFIAMLDALGVDRSALLATPMDGEKARGVALSARNCERVTSCRVDQLTCFNMLNHRYLVIGREELEGWLTGPGSHTGKGVAKEAV